MLSLSAEQHRNVVEQIAKASEEEKTENRELIKKLIQCLYFLVKNHIPHTTKFQGLVTLQVKDGDIKLKTHRDQCPGNATYESYTLVAELLASICNIVENFLLSSLKAALTFH